MIEQLRPLLTMETKLRDIPRIWMDHELEHHIIRPADTTCWLWTGALDKDGSPIKGIKNLDTGKRGTVRLKKVVARIFWSFPDHIDIIQKCGSTNCLNPSHFYLSRSHHSNENRAKMVSEFKRNIKDHIRKTKGLDAGKGED